MKITPYSLIALVLLAFSIGSCGSKKVSPNDANSSIIDSNAQQELFVWVENARIRKEPDLNAEVIAEIKGGEKLMLTSKETKNKIKVKLRGVEFEDVWVKVKTNDEKEGWIFKGMLTENEKWAKDMNDFLIIPGERVGQIKLGSTLKENEEIFGKQFVSNRGPRYYESEEEMPGFTIFRNTSFEVKCSFNDDNLVDRIIVSSQGSLWHTADSIKIGMPLRALVKLNHKPIDFEYNPYGDIINFNEGELIKYNGKMDMLLVDNGKERKIYQVQVFNRNLK